MTEKLLGTGRKRVATNDLLGDIAFQNNGSATLDAVDYQHNAPVPRVSPSISLDFVNHGALDHRVTFTRASTGTFVGKDGLIKTALANAARFGFNPVTLETEGLLIEESRTNLVTYSEELENAAWSKVGVTVVTNNLISPAGLLTGDTLQEDTANSVHIAQAPNVSFTAGTSYTFSAWLKAGSATVAQFYLGGAAFAGTGYANFDLARGEVSYAGSTVVRFSIEPFPNGWYRCSMTVPCSTTNTQAGFIVALVNNDPYAARNPSYLGTSAALSVWGAQVEVGTFPTSYIPTVDSQATRAQDVARIVGPAFARFFNTLGGTLYGEAKTYNANPVENPLGAQGRNPVIVALSNNTIASSAGRSSVYLSRTTAAGFPINALIENAAPASVSQSVGVTQNNGIVKAAVSYNEKFSVAANSGLSSDSDNSVVVPTGLTHLQIGQIFSGPSGNWNSYIRKIAYYPQALTADELKFLTRNN